MGDDSVPGWFARHLWALWLGSGMVLAVAEMLTLDFTLLMLAIGASAGAITAAFFPGQFLIQALVAAAVAVLSLALLRPVLLQRVRDLPGYRNSVDSLVGSQGVARGSITAGGGHVLVNGDTWAARTVDAHTFIPDGALVDVYEVEGTRIVVQAVDPDLRQLPPPDGPPASAG